MVEKDLFYWSEMTDANLRQSMKLERADLDEEALDDLNGTTVWEDAFLRGADNADRGGSNEA
ncbi:hypothetical protein JW851_01250 [Candidatus Woesearchaeota archaeon]|nr:hypothetical protein [Candidatus Woesearchaeota archaeon]